MSHFSEPCVHCKNKIKVALYLSNHTTTFDSKGATYINIPKYAKICKKQL